MTSKRFDFLFEKIPILIIKYYKMFYCVYRDDLTKVMEASGASSPGLLVLTTGLSKPLRRLDKYTGLLQELERHVDEAHADRGDSQRCVSVYRDVQVTRY